MFFECPRCARSREGEGGDDDGDDEVPRLVVNVCWRKENSFATWQMC